MRTEIAIISALTLVLSVPLAFGEIVETKGQNYDLVENFFTGEATWTSHPERIMDGGWQNYALSNTGDKVIFNTNAVGSFVFDKNSCSYSIYGNGFDGEQIIPSVSAVATYYSNGQWQNLPVNDEACMVSVDRYEDGVFLTSTKVITEDITEDVFIPYTGTTENFYSNSTNTNFELIQSSNGTNIGYYNGETITTTGIEKSKFSQEIRLDIIHGFKETFKIWHDGSEELGISQTVHTGESITIGDQTINIAELNGQSFDRQFIVDNEAEILELTDSINYDFDTGIESLSNINIIFDGDYKVNMDFASGNFVGYLEIDPTFTTTGSVNGGNWDFDLSSLNPVDNGITGGTLEGGTLTTSQINDISSNLGSTWSTSTISEDYKIHKFTSTGSSTFTVTAGGGSVSSLIVGGGGAGGNGGGGGGGVLSSSSTVTTGSYPIVVGTGATGMQWYPNPYSQGGDSSFNGMTAGGGGNGGYSGGGIYVTTAGSNGDGTGGAVNGYGGINGGGSGGGNDERGGGGAGNSGQTGTGTNGHGGVGIYSDITGTTVSYGDGGGGGKFVSKQIGGNGNGGFGGGDQCPTVTTGSYPVTSGTANTGGGGGGSWICGGLSGGSGIVVVRYVDDNSITATGGTVSTLTNFQSAYPTLSLNWEVPTVPQAPTGLTTVTGVPVELDWSAPTDTGNTPITGYKVFRTDNQYTFTELPDNSANSAGIDFTGNEFMTHGFEDVTSTVTNSDNIGTTGDLSYNGASSHAGVTGKLNAGHQTGSGTKLSSSASTDFDGDSDELSYGGWFYKTGITGNGRILDKPYTSHTAPYYDWWLGDTGSSGTQLHCAVGASSPSTQATTTTLPTNTWSHVVCVLDDTDLKIYVDGSLQDTTSIVSGTLPTGYNSPFYIGALGNVGSNYFSGTHDEVFIFDRALSADEVSSLYNGGSGARVDTLSAEGLVAYYDFDSDTTNQAPSTYQQTVNTIPDKSTNNISVVLPSLTQEFTSNLGGTSANGISTSQAKGSQLQSGHALIGTTIGQIDFNLACSGTCSGTLEAGVWTTASQTPDVSFGTLDFSTVPSTLTTYSFNSNSHTLAVGDVIGVSCIGCSGTPQAQMSISSDNDPNEVFAESNPSTSHTTWLTNSAHDVDYTAYSGQLSSATSTTGVIDTGIQNPNLSFTDSNLPDNTDDFSVGSWVKLDMGRDSTLDGTANGDPTSTTGKVGNAISFDGVDDKFTLGTIGDWNFLHDGSDFSISWWQKLNSLPSEQQGILGTGTGGSSVGFDLKAQLNNNGRLVASIENGQGATASITSSNNFIPQDTTTWYHYVLTHSNGAWNIYRDGGNNESASSSVSWSTSDHSRDMELANANANTPTDVKDLTADLDEMVIYDRVITSSEISALYNSGSGTSTPNTNGMVAHYDFEQTGNTLESQVYVLPTNTKLLNLNDVTFNVGTTSASVSGIQTTASTLETTASHQVTDASGTQSLTGTTYQISANEIRSGSALIGKTVGKIDLSIYNIGSPTGEAIAGVFDSNGNILYEFGRVDVSTLSNTANNPNANWVTFDDATTSYTLSQGEYFGLYYDGGDSSNKPVSGNDDSSPPFANDYWHRYDGSNWQNYGSLIDLTFRLYEGNPAGSAPFNIISATGLSDNTSTPQHYTFTRSNNDWTIYQNGVSEATATDTTSLGSNAGSAQTSGFNVQEDGTMVTADQGFSSCADYTAVAVQPLIAQPRLQTPTTTGNQACHGAYWNFDLSSISGATVTSATIEYDVSTVNGSPSNCEWVGLTTTPPDGFTTYSDIMSGTVFATNDSSCTTTGTGKTVTLNSAGLSALTTSAGGDFNIGTTFVDSGQVRDSLEDQVRFTENTATLSLTYSVPADYTTNIDGMIDEYFINSDSLTSTEVDMAYEKGSEPTQIDTTGASVTEYDDSNVTGGTEYYYTVKATNAVGDSDFLTPFVSALAGTPPDVPTSVSSTINSPNTAPLDITVSWSAPTNVGTGTLTGFEIYRDSVLIDTTGLVTSYTDTVPSGGGTFEYKLKAVSTHGTSGFSSTTSTTTPSVPPAPTNAPVLAINNPNPSPLDIDVSWTEPASGGSIIQSYEVFRSATETGTYTSVGTVTDLDFTDTVPSAGTWYYKFTAINLVGSSGLSPSNSITTASVPSSPLNASSVIPSINSAPYDVTVSWDLPTSTGGSALTGYNVYRQTGTGAFSLITTTTALGYVDTVPTALNQDYTYKIHAVNNVGESTAFTTTTITTGDVPDAPVLSFTTGTTALSWTVPNSDASITGYEIFRDGSSLTTVTTTSHSDFTPINFGQSYQYEVQAISSLGSSVDSNSIVTTPETEITGMIVQGITGTGAVIDWEEPAYYQGQITSYNVYYSTPATSTNPTISAGTTTNTYSNFAPTLDYDTSYTFGVTINSPLGNSGFSNLVNATTNVDSSIVAYDPTTGGMEWFDIDSVSEQTVNVIEFQRETQNLNVNGTFTDVDTLQVGYPSWWDNMTCDIDYKFAQKTEQYVEGTDMTAVVNSADANQQVIGFEFHDIDNEVIEVTCAPQVSQHDDEVSAKFIMTQQSTTGVPNIPLVTQIQAFQTGDYGTDGEFGALDVVGLFVILISMVGFNRLNPIVGVLLSASLVFGLSFFGIISLPTVLVGVVALVIFLAWGITRNR